MLTITTFIQLVLKVLVSALKQERQIKDIKIRKEEPNIQLH